jgi:hypothetical protein
VLHLLHLPALLLLPAGAVWDLLFFEGSPVVLFRVALSLVEIYEQAGSWWRCGRCSGWLCCGVCSGV